MFDDRLLARALARPAQDTPTRVLDEIMHLAQSARYEVAATRAGELLDGGCKDVRAFVVYALGVFAERGPGAVPSLFAPITVVLGAGISGSDPSSPAARTADTALRFGFRIIKAHLEFHERKSGAAREPWSQHFERSSAASVRRACADLRKAIHEAIEAPRCDAELGSVIARLEAYCGRFSPESPPPSVDARGASPENEAHPDAPPRSPSPPLVAEPPDELPDEALPAPPEPPAFSRRATDDSSDLPTVVISPALRQFMRKLEAFEQLVASGDHAKAAIVAHDVRRVIAEFDPMIYLPNLLSPHFRLLSSNVDQLSPYWEGSGTAGWQALEQLYRVDLEAFLRA